MHSSLAGPRPAGMLGLGLPKSRGFQRISQETLLTSGCPFPSFSAKPCPAALSPAVSPLSLQAGLCESHKSHRLCWPELPDLSRELHLALGKAEAAQRGKLGRAEMPGEAGREP